MSNDPVVNQVSSLNDIVEIVSEYVPLKKAGRNLKACCPFHPEKTASFMVNPEKQIFHCFGCGVGGDVFSFLMKIENLNFPEALQKLADRVHVILPQKGRGKDSAQKSRKEQLYDICQSAAQYYRNNYKDSKIGKAARDYMSQRGFDTQVLDTYGVGFATESWQGLFDYLSKKGFSQDLLFKSGLINISKEGRAFDLFRKRVIFPIQNAQGRIIAFGGRALHNADMPKYLNSPETEVFQKRCELYGLYQAKKHVDPDKSQFLIVEGYLDLIRLIQSGFPNTVATLGTSLTSDHCRLLRRYVMEAVLVYDGDRAGESASIRGIDVFLEEGMNVKLLSFPLGMDPDDFLKQKGSEAFRELLKRAQDVFEFKLAHLLKRFNPNDSVGLVRITNDLLEMLLKVKHSVLIDRYLRRLSGFLGIEESSLRNEFLKLQSKTQGKNVFEEKPEVKKSSSTGASAFAHEWTLLSLVLKGGKFPDIIIKEVAPDDFKDKEARQIFNYVNNLTETGEPLKIGLNELLVRIESEKNKTLFSHLAFFDLSDEDCEKALKDCIVKIKNQNREEKMTELLSKMKQAEASGEEEKVLEYMKKYQDLVVKKKS